MKWALVVVLVLVGCGDNQPVDPQLLISGNAVVTLSASQIFLLRGGSPQLTFTPASFQIGTVDDLDSGDSFDPYWLTKSITPASLVWHTADHFDVVSSTDARLVVRAGDAIVTFDKTLANTFEMSVTSDDPNVAYARFAADANKDEGFYGLGEWGDRSNHRGTLRPMQMEGDFAMEGADNEAHVPVPLLIGTRGWGMFVESDRAGIFDVATQSDTRIEVTFGAPELRVHLFSADAPMDILKHYYDVAGYPGVPAPWAYGPLLWRDGNASQAQVLDDIAQIRTRHLPTSGIWFDRPYASGVETFDFDPVKFPDPHTMLAALHDAGLRYGGWHTPYTAPSGQQDPAPDQHDYATAHGFFPPVTGVLVNQWSKPIDFTNADAYAWWKQNLDTYTRPLDQGGYGLEGFKLDYGEDIVLGLNGVRTPWLFADGSDERTMHRGYTLLYHQIYRDQLASDGAFLLTRTGRWGDQQKGMIIWPGDLDATFDHEGDMIGGTKAVGGLPAAMLKGMNLAASGFPFYASDTAGYRHSPANNECWTRWVEMSAIASAMEVGDSSSQQPWEFAATNGRTQHTLDVYQKYALLHLRLFPYAWTLAHDMATTGYPLVRPLGLAAPELVVNGTDSYEFLFGDALLVAPVVVAGATTRDVFMPSGTWINWWTGEKTVGPAAITVAADLDTLPLFIKEGTAVPMLRPTIETLSPVVGTAIDSFATDPGVLWVRTTGDAKATLYDGTTLDAFEIAGGTVFKQGAMFEAIARAQPTTVTIDGVAVLPSASLVALESAASGWYWEAATGGTLWIKVGDHQRAITE